MDAQIEKKMDTKDSINHNLEDSAVVALTLLRSGVLDNIKATEKDPGNYSMHQCAGTFSSQTAAEQIIDATLLGFNFNCHTVTPGSSPQNTFVKPQFDTTVRREVTCCWLRTPESSLSLLLV